MNFFLSKVGTQLTILFACVILLSSQVKTGIPIELPQTQNSEHDESNLECILGGDIQIWFLAGTSQIQQDSSHYAGSLIREGCQVPVCAQLTEFITLLMRRL